MLRASATITIAIAALGLGGCDKDSGEANKPVQTQGLSDTMRTPDAARDTHVITNRNGEGIGAEIYTSTTSAAHSFRARGGYTVPLNVSTEAAVKSDDPGEAAAMMEFITRHSANGQWTYVIYPVNEIETPGAGREAFMLGDARMNMSEINVSWIPKKYGPYVIEAEGAVDGYQRLDANPTALKVGGNDAHRIRYKNGSDCLAIIGFYNGERYYTIHLSGQDFNGPDGAFGKAMEGMTFK